MRLPQLCEAPRIAIQLEELSAVRPAPPAAVVAPRRPSLVRVGRGHSSDFRSAASPARSGWEATGVFMRPADPAAQVPSAHMYVRRWGSG
jgi:hypothetical protein